GPGLRRILEAARKREIDAVVIWKLDRLGRSTLDLHTNAATLDAYGVRLACVTQPIDTGTPTGKLLFTVLSAVSEFERAIIVERTRLGLNRARAMGRKLGRPPVRLPDLARVRELKADGYGAGRISQLLRCYDTVAAL